MTTPDDLARLAEEVLLTHGGAHSCSRIVPCPGILARAVKELIEENGKLRERREKRIEIHRRMQSAEAGLRRALDPRYKAGERTLGRALANSAACMYHDKCIELEAEVARLRSYESLAKDAHAFLSGLDWNGAMAKDWMERFDALAASVVRERLASTD